MRRLRFPIAVAITSLALVTTLVAIVLLTTPLGALTVGSALANGPWSGRPAWGPWGFGGPGFTLPPELQGLADLPSDQRFAHFVGVQVNLKDKDNRPLTVSVTPGTAAAVSANSLTIAANDGTSKTFALNDDTVIPGKHEQWDAQARVHGLGEGDSVVIVTLNDDTAARAVVKVGKDGFGPGGFGGPPPWFRSSLLHR